MPVVPSTKKKGESIALISSVEHYSHCRTCIGASYELRNCPTVASGDLVATAHKKFVCFLARFPHDA